MGIIDGLLDTLGYVPKARMKKKVPRVLSATARANQYNIPDPSMVERQSELFARLSWVNSAVTSTAALAAKIPFSVFKMVGEDKEEIDNHPLEVLFSKPNPLQSRHELFEATFAFRKLTGNSFWWLNKPSDDSPPSEIWILMPHQVRPVPDERMYLKGYLYDPGDGQRIPLNINEVLHFKSFHPLNPFVGMSAIESISYAATGDIQQQKFHGKFYNSNASLPGIVAIADPIDDIAWIKILKDAGTHADKREMMFMRGTGQGGVSIITNGVSQKDMEFLATRQFTKEEIYSVLSPGLASMLAVNATEANARTGESTLMKLGISPMLSAIAEKITASLLPYYGDDLVGEFEQIVKEDREAELAETETYAEFHTINEVRKERFGDEELEDPRGDLLVAEITRTTKMQEDDLENEGSEEEPEEKEEEEPIKMGDSLFIKDLKSYKRKALNQFGKKSALDFEFISDGISSEILNNIKAKLKGCKTKKAIVEVFESVKIEMKGEGTIFELITSLQKATEAIRSK